MCNSNNIVVKFKDVKLPFITAAHKESTEVFGQLAFLYLQIIQILT